METARVPGLSLAILQEGQLGWHNTYGLANTRTPVEAVEGYDLPHLFRELGIGQHYRIGWVEKNLDARDTIHFVQTVLANRGLPGLVFDTEDEARTWLLGGD